MAMNLVIVHVRNSVQYKCTYGKALHAYKHSVKDSVPFTAAVRGSQANYQKTF